MVKFKHLKSRWNPNYAIERKLYMKMHVTFVFAIFLLNSQNHKVDLIKIGVIPDNWVQIDHIPQGLYSIHPRTGQCYYYALCDEVKRACPMRKGWTQCPA